MSVVACFNSCEPRGGVAQTLLQRLGSQEEFGAGIQQICLS